MRTSTNLNQTAQGASASTANTRKRVKSTCTKVALKKKSLSSAQKDLEITKTFPTFVVPRNVKDTESVRYISNRLNKAGFLSDNSTSVVLRFLAETEWRLASFLHTYFKILVRTMPRNDKNLKATAQGASASTANTRKRVKSTIDKSSVAQSKNSLHPIFPLKITGNQVLPVTLITRVGNHLSVLHDGENYIIPINPRISFFENVAQALNELIMDGVELDWVAETGRGTLVIEDNCVYLWHDYAAHKCFAHGSISEERFKKITQVKLY